MVDQSFAQGKQGGINGTPKGQASIPKPQAEGPRILGKLEETAGGQERSSGTALPPREERMLDDLCRETVRYLESLPSEEMRIPHLRAISYKFSNSGLVLFKEFEAKIPALRQKIASGVKVDLEEIAEAKRIGSALALEVNRVVLEHEQNPSNKEMLEKIRKGVNKILAYTAIVSFAGICVGSYYEVGSIVDPSSKIFFASLVLNLLSHTLLSPNPKSEAELKHKSEAEPRYKEPRYRGEADQWGGGGGSSSGFHGRGPSGGFRGASD
jgi:hypothetical protein